MIDCGGIFRGVKKGKRNPALSPDLDIATLATSREVDAVHGK